MSGRGGTRRKGGGQGGACVRQKKAHKKERQLGRDEYLIVGYDASDATGVGGLPWDHLLPVRVRAASRTL